MEYALLGWPASGPTLRLDFRTFSYAGKFVMSNTGKAVVRDPGRDPADLPDLPERPGDADDREEDPFDREVVAAVAFNEDRTDPGVLWLRYVTVHRDYRGQELGAELAALVAERAADRGYRRCRIAVNNPFAYEALYKAGFVYTGRETGLAELVLERPGERDAATYQCGLDVFRDRDLSDAEVEFLLAREDGTAPDLVSPPNEDVVVVEDARAGQEPEVGPGPGAEE